MKNGKYYSSVRYRKKDYKGLVIGILSAVLIILIAFCIWAVATFAGGGEGAFENQTDRYLCVVRRDYHGVDIDGLSVIKNIAKARVCTGRDNVPRTIIAKQQNSGNRDKKLSFKI